MHCLGLLCSQKHPSKDISQSLWYVATLVRAFCLVICYYVLFMVRYVNLSLTEPEASGFFD